MRKNGMLGLLVFLLVIVGGCFDNKDSNKESPVIASVEVSVSKDKIISNGIDAVTFSAIVKDNSGKNIDTADVHFYINNTVLNTNVFRTTLSGNYYLVAKINNIISKEVLITAKEEAKCYLYKAVYPYDSGSILINNQENSDGFTSGTSIKLQPIPKDGYIFKKWEGINSDEINDKNEIIMNTDKEITAVFEKNISNITIEAVKTIQENQNYNAEITLINNNGVSGRIVGITREITYNGGVERKILDNVETEYKSNSETTISAVIIDKDNIDILSETDNFTYNIKLTIKDVHNNIITLQSNNLTVDLDTKYMNIISNKIYDDVANDVNGYFIKYASIPDIELRFREGALITEQKAKERIKLVDINKTTDIAIELETSGNVIKIRPKVRLEDRGNYRVIVQKDLISDNGFVTKREYAYDFGVQLAEFNMETNPANNDYLYSAPLYISINFNRQIKETSLEMGKNIVVLENGSDISMLIEKGKYNDNVAVSLNYSYKANTEYTVIIKEIEDVYGNILGTEKQIKFTVK